MKQALDLLREFGCWRLFLDGSFVTAKETPGDYDGCWEVEGVDLTRLLRAAPLLWDDRPGRPHQKAQFGGDLFPVRMAGQPQDRRILDDFQRDKLTGEPKGILDLNLDTMS